MKKVVVKINSYTKCRINKEVVVNINGLTNGHMLLTISHSTRHESDMHPQVDTAASKQGELSVRLSLLAGSLDPLLAVIFE